MTNIKMEHTALGQGEGNGRISFVFAHDNLTSTYSTMKSAMLANYAPGDLIHLELSVGETGRRSIISHSIYRGVHTEWEESYRDTLAAEEAHYKIELSKVMGVDVSQLEEFEDEDEDIDVEPTPEPEPINRDRRAHQRIWISDRDNRLYDVMHKISSNRGLSKILLVGPSGFGKSSVPKQKAHDWDMDFLRWDCATVRDPEEFFGFRGAQNGSTQNEDGSNIFTPSLFTQKLMQGNTVILLDELSRLDPTLANVLFPILDDARSISIAGHEIELGPNLVICASINVGFQYTGTWTLDEALRNRFDVVVELGALPFETEVEVAIERNGVNRDMAEKSVTLMQKLRALAEDETIELDASTRTTLAMTQLISAGLPPHEAIFYTVISGVEKSQRVEIVNAAGTTFGVSFDD